jgi:YD repeat-containing protein
MPFKRGKGNFVSLDISGPVNGYNYDIHYNYLSQEIDNNKLYGITNTNTYNEDTYGNNILSSNTNSAATTVTQSTYITEPSIGWSGQLPSCMATYSITTTRLSQIPYTRTSSYLYNNYGEPTTKTDDIGLITNYAYDVLGNISGVTIGGGVPNRTTSYTYDSPYERFITTETNPLNQSISATYDNAYGNTLTSTDLNRLTTHYAYDGFGRMQQMTLPTTEQVTASRLWNNVSGLTNSLFYVQVSAPGEATMSNYYDKLGKTLRSQKNGFDGTNINTDMTYYDDQQLETETEPYYTGNSPQLNNFTYDDFQRQSVLTNAAQLTATYSYTYGQPTYTLVTKGSNAPTKTFSQTYDASEMLRIEPIERHQRIPIWVNGVVAGHT